jgi:hypothetical protein
MSRSRNLTISRNSDSNIEEDHWLKQFEKSLKKESVQSRNVDQSLFDQISSIMNGAKSKYSSVDDAVKEMKERSGLAAYLSKAESLSNKKVAQDVNDTFDKKVPGNIDKVIIPSAIKKCPSIKTTIENYIRSTNGNLALPAILEHIKSIHKEDVQDADWEDSNLLKFISQVNVSERQKHPTNKDYSSLGLADDSNNTDIDPSNSDAFNILQPAKI